MSYEFGKSKKINIEPIKDIRIFYLVSYCDKDLFKIKWNGKWSGNGGEWFIDYNYENYISNLDIHCENFEPFEVKILHHISNKILRKEFIFDVAYDRYDKFIFNNKVKKIWIGACNFCKSKCLQEKEICEISKNFVFNKEPCSMCKSEYQNLKYI